MPRPILDRLTPREQEVLDFWINGVKARHIAVSLSISYRSVECHIHHIYRKLQVGTRQACCEVVRERKLAKIWPYEIYLDKIRQLEQEYCENIAKSA